MSMITDSVRAVQDDTWKSVRNRFSEGSWDEVRAVKTLTKGDSDVRAYRREFRTYDNRAMTSHKSRRRPSSERSWLETRSGYY